MIRNSKELAKFEKKLISSSKPDFKKNLKIVEALYAEYRKLNPQPRDPLDGIEVSIRIAKVINSV